MKFYILALAIFLFAGCQLFQTSAPLAIPSATCLILKKEPGSFSYLKALESAVRRFSVSRELTADSLRNALMGVPVDGIEPYVANAAYSVIVVAYGGLAEKYATASDREPKLREALVAVADGLNVGIVQCAPPQSDSGVPTIVRLKQHGAITEGSLNKLAKQIARDLKRR